MNYIEDRDFAPCTTCGTNVELDRFALCDCGFPWCDTHTCTDCLEDA